MSETATKIYDIYAALLNYKKSITKVERPVIDMPLVPEHHQRRMAAYELLSAYYFNYSRDFRFSPESSVPGQSSENDSIIEEGTPEWLCEKIKAKLLGDKISIVIRKPRRLKNLSSQKSKVEGDIKAGKQGADLELQALIPLEEELAKLSEKEAFIQDWFDDNYIVLSILDGEKTGSYLGDMVYMTEWPEGAKKPNIKTYDPGFFIPDEDAETSLEEGVEDDVIERCCIAWTEYLYEDGNKVPVSRKVYRDVYELRLKGEKTFCFRQEGYYRYDGEQGADIWDIDTASPLSGGEWVDLGIDFVPILHIPNIQVEGNRFGLSNQHMYISIFDTIMNAMTDLSKNASHLGGASVFTSGKDIKMRRDQSTGMPEAVPFQPNAVYHLGEGGDATLLDTSLMQKALLETIDALDKRLVRNSCITDVGAGKVDLNQVSGVVLRLLMQPLIDKIGPMRTQRQAQYEKLFTMVQKLYAVFGSPEEKALFADPVAVVMQFGDILPTDETAYLDNKVKEAGLIGKKATIERMQGDGYGINAEDVMRDLESESQANAAQMQDMFNFRRATEIGAQA